MAAESKTFRWVSEALHRVSPLSPLEARGTIRLALRSGGLEAHSVDPDSLSLVLDQILPGMLRQRGIEGGERICDELLRKLHTVDLREDRRAQATPGPAQGLLDL